MVRSKNFQRVKRRCTTVVLVIKSLSNVEGFSIEPMTIPVARAIRRAHESLPQRSQIEQIRCPFWRRRATDALEGCESVLRFVAARHKSLVGMLPAVLLDDEFNDTNKRRHRSIEAIALDLENEFRRKHYYVTGRLDFSLYTDTAFFNAPDPDMPCFGPAKFADALSGLFFSPRSHCDLLDITICQDQDSSKKIQALWRLQGVLRLPWRPTIKSFVGETTYYLNDDGLIDAHIEEWSIPVVDAFLSAIVNDDFASAFRALPAPPTHELANDLDAARSLIIRHHQPVDFILKMRKKKQQQLLLA
uniref:Uncharacterized protein n=1 Tax=Aureoumbra lagunensis TaxID=44058 RepID=A0A7S3K150_9STRA|mmetsp:Transcript_3484/g.4887  ORF Transcript_3484/g.4887 Transcript_3484/m.4887 type:complete len:303 (+) Transcript_3484:80-988(+)